MTESNQKNNSVSGSAPAPLSTSNLQQLNSHFASNASGYQPVSKSSSTSYNLNQGQGQGQGQNQNQEQGHNRHSSGNFKHYNNNNGAGNKPLNSNRPGYNNRKSFNNKPNHHHSQQQHPLYNYNTAAVYNGMMYYPGYGYQVMNPMAVYGQQGAQQMMPNPNVAYNGVNPNLNASGSAANSHIPPLAGGLNNVNMAQPHFYQSPPVASGKIKITDKEGRQINLEEGKQNLRSNTSLSSPKAATAIPDKPAGGLNNQSTATLLPSNPSTGAPLKPTTQPPQSAEVDQKANAVEDFKQRILMLAKKAKDSKANATSEKKEVEKKEPEKKEVEIKEVKVSESEKSRANVDVAQSLESVKSQTSDDVESKVKQPVSKKEELPQQQELKEELVKKIDSQVVDEQVVAEVKEDDLISEETSRNPSSVSVAFQEPTPQADSKLKQETEDENEKEEVKSTMSLSLFLERVKTVEGIQDPFSTKYPEPLVSVDPKWKSPITKYRYDPQFLIQFQDVVKYEVDDAWKKRFTDLGLTENGMKFASLSGFKGKQGGNSRFNQSFGKGGYNSNFDNPRQNSRNGSKRKVGSGRDKSKRGNPSRRREKEEEEEKIPPEEIKPLEKSANRWVPRSRNKDDEVKLAPDGVTPILSESEVERKVNSLLNKLTLEMFDDITDDILKLIDQSKWEDDAKTVKQVISLTFSKACDEPYWSSMYAQLCAKMVTKISDDISEKDAQGKKHFGGDLARRLLLTTCQKEYEKGWSDKVPLDTGDAPLEMMSEEYYILAKAKRRGLGLVKFIGQLYLLGMLTDKVIISCLSGLSKNVEDPSEDSLESLAELLQAIGLKFSEVERNRGLLQMVFENIQKILDNVKLSSRIKFKLMDLQDLKKANWKSKKGDEGPKTIKEIHDDAEIKKLEEEKLAMERRRKNKPLDSRSNSSRGSSWGSAPKRLDSNLKLGPIKDSKGFTAVPRSQSNRVSEANSPFALSPRENSKRTESLQSNMFAALGDDDHHDDQHNDKLGETDGVREV